MKVTLRPLDRVAALAVAAGNCPPGFSCADDYPAESDRIAAAMFLERLSAGLDPRPFGGFLVVLTPPLLLRWRRSLVVGGIGFHGGPDDRGQVEIGYGIVSSREGRGYATRALGLLIERAQELGVASLIAEVELANMASRKVLTRCQFVSVADDPRTFLRALNS